MQDLQRQTWEMSDYVELDYEPRSPSRQQERDIEGLNCLRARINFGRNWFGSLGNRFDFPFTIKSRLYPPPPTPPGDCDRGRGLTFLPVLVALQSYNLTIDLVRAVRQNELPPVTRFRRPPQRLEETATRRSRRGLPDYTQPTRLRRPPQRLEETATRRYRRGLPDYTQPTRLRRPPQRLEETATRRYRRGLPDYYSLCNCGIYSDNNKLRCLVI
ncbi:hypothetical protein J6590_024167 [Homalodisca vitripennis]|nr:hypothetical protein J6590_024167 [Homalodisca vitripennis]